MGVTRTFTCSLMLLDRAILWTDSIFYIVRELMSRMRMAKLVVVGDSMESQASGLEAQTKRGNLELVVSLPMLNLGSDLLGAEWVGLGEVKECGKGSPMLCTPLNILNPFL